MSYITSWDLQDKNGRDKFISFGGKKLLNRVFATNFISFINNTTIIAARRKNLPKKYKKARLERRYPFESSPYRKFILLTRTLFQLLSQLS